MTHPRAHSKVGEELDPGSSVQSRAQCGQWRPRSLVLPLHSLPSLNLSVRIC